MKGSTIIAGSFKRAYLGVVPKGLLVRPILGRIKKSLFDILRNQLEHAKFLDLFSGSGSVGIEALSRGADKVVFVDANPRCRQWVDNSLKRLAETFPNERVRERSQTHCANVLNGLGWLREEFNVIFCGAPYVDAKKTPLFFVDKVLEMVKKQHLLAPDGWFIAQHHANEKFEAKIPWEVFRVEKYGDTVLTFIKQSAAAPREG